MHFLGFITRSGIADSSSLIEKRWLTQFHAPQECKGVPGVSGPQGHLALSLILILAVLVISGFPGFNLHFPDNQ